MLRIREASPNGLVDEEYVGAFVPRMRISGKITMHIDLTRAFEDISVNVLAISLQCDAPSSMKSPVVEEQPGPPLVQKMTSSVLGSFLLSKK